MGYGRPAIWCEQDPRRRFYDLVRLYTRHRLCAELRPGCRLSYARQRGWWWTRAVFRILVLHHLPTTRDWQENHHQQPGHVRFWLLRWTLRMGNPADGHQEWTRGMALVIHHRVPHHNCRGGICWIFIPTSAENAWFLSVEEKEVMRRRKERDAVFRGENKFDRK